MEESAREDRLTVPTLQHSELLAQGQILQDETAMHTEGTNEYSGPEAEKVEHGAR
jgi:hypothetical protein